MGEVRNDEPDTVVIGKDVDIDVEATREADVEASDEADVAGRKADITGNESEPAEGES